MNLAHHRKHLLIELVCCPPFPCRSKTLHELRTQVSRQWVSARVTSALAHHHQTHQRTRSRQTTETRPYPKEALAAAVDTHQPLRLNAPATPWNLTDPVAPL